MRPRRDKPRHRLSRCGCGARHRLPGRVTSLPQRDKPRHRLSRSPSPVVVWGSARRGGLRPWARSAYLIAAVRLWCFHRLSRFEVARLKSHHRLLRCGCRVIVRNNQRNAEEHRFALRRFCLASRRYASQALLIEGRLSSMRGKPPNTVRCTIAAHG